MKCRWGYVKEVRLLATYEPLRGLQDDHLYTPRIKQHSLQKIRLHNYYVNIFAKAMKNRWPQMAYIGLYCGAGRAMIAETGEIVETSAMSALRIGDPFTKYIFVDNDPRCIEALDFRIAALSCQYDVTLINKDVCDAVPDIIAAMPRYTKNHGLLSFCFVDPFSAALDFEVIRALGSRYRMDFLVLLMLGLDVRQNFKRYLQDPSDTRIARLIDDPNWRQDWKSRGYPDRYIVRYILEKFDAAMARLGYKPRQPTDAYPVTVTGKSVFLYSLVLYSKHPLGQKFWREAQKGTSRQLTFW